MHNFSYYMMALYPSKVECEGLPFLQRKLVRCLKAMIYTLIKVSFYCLNIILCLYNFHHYSNTSVFIYTYKIVCTCTKSSKTCQK